MSEDKKRKLAAVRKTLEKISVQGKDNLDMLLGCILAIDKLIDEQEEINELLDSN